ncbi:pseudouridylate synthase I [Sterolibacterium denitrificans]|uniref:tRNA pseudouridine synthase A n=2 Tax=Sterolibacterium denitrificans TaxID=157592 RepID=A0A7Z7HTD8_9PROT|nr:tRNA pseudouridine(38-40) synthase TruA [Sterolibacterium denitrificans]SMB30248.1 pseudouridylate synthase I [Sterolibacterium denitrificans]
MKTMPSQQQIQRIALGIEYDGAAFHGWQSQPHGQTVQDVLEQAIGQVAAQPIRVHCAGRTDAGVHALNQVVHFDCAPASVRPQQAWIRGVNAHLPSSVCVRWAQPVAADFHARFDARARHYCYLLHNHPVRPALMHGRLGWHHHPLDAARMQAAAQALLGEHDFSAFRAAECQAKSAVKIMQQATVRRHGELIIFEFRADAFLQHMVRNMVGALVAVGNGREAVDSIARLLASGDRRRAAPTFSAAGLYLVGVDYAPHWNIPLPARIMPALFEI